MQEGDASLESSTAGVSEAAAVLLLRVTASVLRAPLQAAREKKAAAVACVAKAQAETASVEAKAAEAKAEKARWQAEAEREAAEAAEAAARARRAKHEAEEAEQRAALEKARREAAEAEAKQALAATAILRKQQQMAAEEAAYVSREAARQVRLPVYWRACDHGWAAARPRISLAVCIRLCIHSQGELHSPVRSHRRIYLLLSRCIRTSAIPLAPVSRRR